MDYKYVMNSAGVIRDRKGKLVGILSDGVLYAGSHAEIHDVEDATDAFDWLDLLERERKLA